MVKTEDPTDKGLTGLVKKALIVVFLLGGIGVAVVYALSIDWSKFNLSRALAGAIAGGVIGFIAIKIIGSLKGKK